MCEGLTFPFDPIHTKVIRGSKVGRQIFDPIGLDKELNPDEKPYKKEKAPVEKTETPRERDARMVKEEAKRQKLKRTSTSQDAPISTVLG